MNNENQIKLIAIVGGSGSGKSWLAAELKKRLEPQAETLSLDNFYFDLSNLTAAARDGINYDHPQTIDWPLFENVLDDCLCGRATGIPQYDFAAHARLPMVQLFQPAPLILVEGLWLLREAKLRNWFALKIFLDSPEQLRLKRRLIRDVTMRGRSPEFVREQFQNDVLPMHKRFIAPQKEQADIILRGEPREFELLELKGILQFVALEKPEPRIASNF